MEMPDDCFMSASIASVTMIDGERGEEGTEDYDSGLSVKMIISSTLRDGVVCKDLCVCVCWRALAACEPRLSAASRTHTPKKDVEKIGIRVR